MTISRTLCEMLCSKFQPDSSPVFFGMFSFNSSSSSTDIWWSLSKPSAVRPKRRCCIFHFNAARWTCINLSLGSAMRGNLYSGEPGCALRMLSLTNLTCRLHIWCYIGGYIVCYFDYTSGAIRSRSKNGRVRRRILTRSPDRCFPLCFSMYMS